MKIRICDKCRKTLDNSDRVFTIAYTTWATNIDEVNCDYEYVSDSCVFKEFCEDCIKKFYESVEESFPY